MNALSDHDRHEGTAVADEKLSITETTLRDTEADMAEDAVMDLDDSELSSLSGDETDGPTLPKRSTRPQKGGDSVENGQTRELITDGL